MSQAHLHGEQHLGAAQHLTLNLLNAVGVLEKSAPAPGLSLHGERAAHIEVYPLPALLLQCVAEPCELVAAGGYHLRHRGHACVALGVGVAQILLSHLPLFNPHKRRIVLIHPADALMVRPPVDSVGVALQRGEGNVHVGYS